ncbi:MAG: RNA recognition motif-containing protein [Vezdaea aestivalis]|nr:MAG: RNA recognition motif-containing protein [Vezdaea aestivalis]
MDRPSKKRKLSPGKEGVDPIATEPQPSNGKIQSRRQLFVCSLPASATSESLAEYFSQSYPLKHATVVTDPKTKVCKGFGFVTFADSEDAERAKKELNGTEFDGKKIRIEVAEARSRGEDGKNEKNTTKSIQNRVDHQPPKLIIRNLPWSIDEPDKLALLFRSFGKVKYTDLPKNKHGKMAGFGFVTLRGRKNSSKAMEALNGKEIDGRTLAVDWAVDKKTWGDLQQQNLPVPESKEDVEDNRDGSPMEIDGPVDVESEEEEVYSRSGSEELENSGPLSQDLEADEVDDSDDNDDDEEEFDTENGNRPRRTTPDTSMTIFVRNLPFSATDDTLFDHFRQFGALKYARVVYDQASERPRGTGFVSFYRPDEAIACLKAAPRPAKEDTPQPNKRKASQLKSSILRDELSDLSGQFTLDGRVLQLARAVNREDAVRLTQEGSAHRDRRDRDKRRLYLLTEGTISSNSPLYASLPPSEIATREASSKQRKTLIKSNPALHLSFTRLSIRNIPHSITSKSLKALAREAVVGFAKDVKAGKRQPLSREENDRGGEEMKASERQRKLKGKGIVRQAKIVFESRDGSKVTEDSGAGRSRGYGFIEYSSHRWALMGLRWLNGHVVDYKTTQKLNDKSQKAPEERQKRLIVEFAIENAQVVSRRRDRESRAGTVPQQVTQQHEPMAKHQRGSK